jgi:hypothetical protein
MGQARTRGLALALLDRSGEAQPRLTSGGEAAIDAVTFCAKP